MVTLFSLPPLLPHAARLVLHGFVTFAWVRIIFDFFCRLWVASVHIAVTVLTFILQLLIFVRLISRLFE